MNTCSADFSLSPEAVLAIAQRAATLEERLARVRAQAADQPPVCVADARLQTWGQNASAGNRPAFLRRLAWDAISEEVAHRALGLEEVFTKLLPWAEFFLALQLGSPSSEEEHLLDSHFSEQPPFAPLVFPFLAEARRRLETDFSAALSHLSRSAYLVLQQNLLSRLAQLAAPAFFQIFSAGAKTSNAAETSRTRYLKFIRHTLEPAAFGAFFFAYPVLARMLSQQSLSWVATSAEMLTRWEEDQADLATHFLSASEFSEDGLGRIEHLQLGLSDAHHGGQQVAILETSRGQKIVYKPKDVSLETAFARLLEKLGEMGARDLPATLRVLDRTAYGWVEFAHPEPAGERREVHAFFRRSGALLALVYALEGSDCHMENVVATAGGPVLVDLEALLQPRLKPWSAQIKTTDAFQLAGEHLSRSVLGTGLLPLWQRGRRGDLHDVGGLGGSGGYESSYQRIVWDQVNTDAMRPRTEFSREPDAPNRILLGGAAQNPADYLEDLLAGFSGLYSFLLERREDVLREAWAPLEKCRARLIFRPSQHYALLLREARNLRCLRDGLERSFVFERLCGAFSRASERPYLWPLVRVEKAALENLDVPYFSMSTGSCDLLLPSGETIAGCCEKSSFAASREILQRLSAADLTRQTDFIRAAFLSPMHTPEQATLGPADAVERALAAINPLSTEEFLTSAVALAQQIAARAIVGADGVATWLSSVQWQPDLHGQRGGPYYLYDGSCGVALFLAAVCRATGNQQLRPLIAAACRPIAAMVRHPEVHTFLAAETIGGCSGLGSVVYTFVLLAQLLEDASFLEIAHAVSRCLSPEKIQADQTHDVHSGSAGAILSLLALHSAISEPEVLRRAEQCGEHLLQKKVAGPKGGAAWKSHPEGTLLAGFAHGAAGIATALARLSAVTGREDFRATAQEALAYERTIFVSAAQNWPVLAPEGSGQSARLVNSWCHGAPGVALSRLASLGILEDSALREELEMALDSTVRGGMTGLDHLCCGNFGRIEILRTAAEKLSNDRWKKIANVGATAVVLRAKHRGTFELQKRPELDRAFQPGFYRGLSGIGYGLLRAARPGLLPCVLSFDTIL